jgi:hypothetical protein
MITFGICVGPGVTHRQLDVLISSINREMTDDLYNPSNKFRYEIILCGNQTIIDHCQNIGGPIRPYNFDETERPGWITRKKNLIAQAASGDALVLLHDYYKLEPGWLKAFHAFDTLYEGQWQVMLNRVLTLEGYRHSDWLIHPQFLEELCIEFPGAAKRLMEEAPHENHPKYVCGLPYHVGDLTHLQYVSGGYMVVKTDFLLANPWNEDLAWGDAEDLEWSSRVLRDEGWPILFFNPAAKVSVQKPGKWRVFQTPYSIVEDLRERYGRREPV